MTRYRTKAKREAMRRKREKMDAAQNRMRYRGLINVDFTEQDPPEYQKLVTALIKLGWKYLETSALTIETGHSEILRALEILARQCRHAGALSALTLHIQGAEDFNGKPYKAAEMYPDALDKIREKPLP